MGLAQDQAIGVIVIFRFNDRYIHNSILTKGEHIMFNRFIYPLLLLWICVFVVGCSALFSQQEWSDNYALLDGTNSTSLAVIDGNIETVGQAQPKTGTGGSIAGAPEVVITLPIKKVIRKVVIHSDNIKKFNLYIDKGGSALSDSDWQLIKEAQSVKTGRIVVPVLYAFPTDRVRLVVLGTKDDAALTRKQGLGLRGGLTNRTGST